MLFVSWEIGYSLFLFSGRLYFIINTKTTAVSCFIPNNGWFASSKTTTIFHFNSEKSLFLYHCKRLLFNYFPQSMTVCTFFRRIAVFILLPVSRCLRFSLDNDWFLYFLNRQRLSIDHLAFCFNYYLLNN